jgi:hypothetical protein
MMHVEPSHSGINQNGLRTTLKTTLSNVSTHRLHETIMSATEGSAKHHQAPVARPLVSNGNLMTKEAGVEEGGVVEEIGIGSHVYSYVSALTRSLYGERKCLFQASAIMLEGMD